MTARLYHEGVRDAEERARRCERARGYQAELEAAACQATPSINHFAPYLAASTMGDYMSLRAHDTGLSEPWRP